MDFFVKKIHYSPMRGHKEITERFGDRVRTLRRSRGLSQEALADLAGLDRTYISGIERGKRNVSLRNIDLIARALKVRVRDLFKGL